MEINKQVNIPYLLKIGFGKTSKLGKYLFDKEFYNIALFYGKGIEDMLGAQISESLVNNNVKVIHQEMIDSIAIEDINTTAFNLPSNIDAIVGIGGGKVLDYAKYTAHLLRLPYISMPTSMSNDGFCSPSSSLTVGKNRRTVKSSIPFGVVIDLDIIKNSPKIFMYSGIGDMLSKVTAITDWKEAVKRGNAKNNDFSIMMTYNSLDLLFLRHSHDVFAPEFIRSLSNSLLVSGITMEIAGSSRPASGSEHLISHALDRVLASPQMHGIQVGVATLLCALLQDNEHTKGLKEVLEKIGFIDFVAQNPFNKEDFIKAVKLAPSIKNNYWTVLSQADSFERAVHFIDTDTVLKRLIV